MHYFQRLIQYLYRHIRPQTHNHRLLQYHSRRRSVRRVDQPELFLQT